MNHVTDPTILDRTVRSAGMIFGYPPCCIDALEERMRNKQFLRTDKSRRVLQGTGFVPCIPCAERGEQYLLDYIKQHRLCSHEFPNCRHGIGHRADDGSIKSSA